MANLDIAERRIPQDGRIRAVVHGRKLDLRMSTLPMVSGEKVGAQCRRQLASVVFDDEITFAIETHRAAAEVCRADAQPAVVDDHDLAVNIDLFVIEIFGNRCEDFEAAGLIRGTKTIQGFVAQDVHGHLLQPS